MNRRNVLIGLGGVVAGGGALLGTGAFTTVEAQRTVTVNTDGDAGALLSLTEAGDGESSDVVSIQNGLLEIDFDAAGEDGQGVNLNALTTVGKVSGGSFARNDDPNSLETAALEITNNGTETVNISFDIGFNTTDQNFPEDTDVENPEDILKLWTDASGNKEIGEDNFGNLVADELTGLETGNSVQVALQIDTVGLDENDVDMNESLFEDEATITATSQPNGQ